jgi:hypothetical protein
MKIKWDTEWLADDTRHAFGLTANGKRLVQETQLLRALNLTFFDRGNRRLQLGFSVWRAFGTTRLSEEFMLAHFHALPGKATLTIRCGLSSETPTDYVCQDCVLEAVEFPEVKGTAVATRYSILIPAVSGIATTVTDECLSGTFAIPSGVSTVTVTGLALAATPQQVIANVRKPANGYQMFAVVVDGTQSASGFTAHLSGLTNSASYRLDFLLKL